MKTLCLPLRRNSLPGPRPAFAPPPTFPRPLPPLCPAPLSSPLIDELDDLVAAGGPEPDQYARLGASLHELARQCRLRPDGRLLQSAVRGVLAPTLLKGTIHGFLYLQPHGYPGDFELIERLLSFHHSTDPNLVRWDSYCHSLPAVRALRSRAAHLRELLRQLEAGDCGAPCRVLHFRSGPAREFADYFIAHGAGSRIRCDCVDPDPNAIVHGRRIVARLTDRMAFHQASLLRFHPPQPYRLIWSSSLCETLDDRAFVAILRRLLRLLEPEGRLVLCQLSEPDDSAALLELLADWRLHYRDARRLEMLAAAAGAAPDEVRVLTDPGYPNLFLHLRNRASSRAARVRAGALPVKSLTFPAWPGARGQARIDSREGQPAWCSEPPRELHPAA